MTYKVLVINPNSSVKVTNDMSQIIHSDTVTFDYYTAPSEAPKEIDGHETSQLSAAVVLPDLISKQLHVQYDGYLICCFSNHPLLTSLKQHTDKPIMGIMQACLIYHYMDFNINQSMIITSSKSWEAILDEEILGFYRIDQWPNNFHRTSSFNINVLNLNNPTVFHQIKSKVASIIGDRNIDCVLLGCAGMVGLDEKLAQEFPHIKFIDSVKIGVELLTSMIRFNHNSSTPSTR